MTKEAEENGKSPAFNGPRSGGLTKREYFIAAALQGLCAGRTEYESPEIDLNMAIRLADNALEALSYPITESNNK